MATWETLRQYIASNYVIAAQDPMSVRLVFDLGNGRSQNVMVVGHMEAGYEYVVIWTLVCHESQISLRDALLRNMHMPVGHLAMAENGAVVLRHTAPLKDLDIDEFEVPLRAVTQAGDMLEAQYTMVDQY
jgi:hypothetical protein